MPMIDLSVVVLPAPLRPSSVTTSPARTLKFAPCRMWDSPYQAFRPSAASSGVPETSSMAGPHIRLPHFGIVRDRCVIALGEHAPAREHRDAMGKVGDDAEIVLDHQHRAVCRNRFDQGGDALDVLMA